MNLKMTSLIRCYHYNLGYCKNKNNCIYLHSDEECVNNCIDDNCLKRHRKLCKDGENCFYYNNNKCEFNHIIKYNINKKKLWIKGRKQKSQATNIKAKL